MSAKDRKAALADHLRQAVLTCELAPGQDMDEVALCDAFGLSRTPVREVFRELDGEGYLDLREGRGVRVAEMSHTTLRDFFIAAPMVYGAVLRLAARNGLPHQIARLKAAQEDYRTALRNGSAADRTLANNSFHLITGEMAANTYLLPSFHRLLIDHARIGMTFYQPVSNQMVSNVSASADQHDQMIAAIETRDEQKAAELADAHWALSREEIERFVMPPALDVPLGTYTTKAS